ncbi:hypothetical protein ILYODFUR_006037 [Ilyodon furcidens]|uniref:Uncharacterized protein n=1 Tax=Ilyodon furcidens TaxID=33524 RepID=A0ABV0SIU8_9TELE
MDEPPPHPDPVSGPVPEGFMDEPPPHPDPVSGPVPEGFLDEEDAPSPPAVSRQLRCRTPRPRQRSQRSPHCNSELHRGFSWSVIGSYVASLLIAGSARAGRLNSGSAEKASGPAA